MTSQRTVFSAVVVFCLLNLCTGHPHGTAVGSWPPFEGGPPPQFQDDCLHNEDVLTLCQTCAKQTKSTVVYPMCCEGREDARSWCERYMAYGRNTDGS